MNQQQIDTALDRNTKSLLRLLSKSQDPPGEAQKIVRSVFKTLDEVESRIDDDAIALIRVIEQRTAGAAESN